MSEEDIEWLKNQLHTGDCRQCNLIRQLIEEHEEERCDFDCDHCRA